MNDELLEAARGIYGFLVNRDMALCIRYGSRNQREMYSEEDYAKLERWVRVVFPERFGPDGQLLPDLPPL